MNEPKLSQRLLSLDALRGFDMLFIMGFATLVVNVCHIFPGDVSAAVAESMSHPAWHGFSHHDTISYPFSLAKQRSLGATQGDLYRKILKRGALLILFGLIYNGLFRLDWPMRTASVLGRIGLAWALAAMLFLNFRTRTRIGIVGAILVGYWALLALVPAPDAPAGADVYSMEGTIVGYIDRLLLPGKLHNKIFDPEGLLSTVPAVATAMLGMLTGEFVRLSEQRLSGNRKALYIALAAVAFTLVGILCSFLYCPISREMRMRLAMSASSSSSSRSICCRSSASGSVVWVVSRTTSVCSMKQSTSGVTCCCLSLHASSGVQCDSTISPSKPRSMASCESGAISSRLPPMWLGSHSSGSCGSRRRSSIGMCHWGWLR